MRRTVNLLINFYQRFISPLLGKHCRYRPTCSEFTRQAINRFGLFRGLAAGLKRLLSCHPLGGSGHDPVSRLESDQPEKSATK